MRSCLVVTAPDDPCIPIASSVPGVQVFETDAFSRHGAKFNKGLAMQEGLEFLSPEGWILIHDADILFPPEFALPKLDVGILYGATRRILEDPARWHEGLDFGSCMPSRDGGPIGFFQLFHAADPHLAGKRPWYDVTFAHAGGGDAYFLMHWPTSRRRVLPIECLHLGPKDTNWWGCSEECRDIMARFVTENGWRAAARKFRPEQIARAAEYHERVNVPGYPPSTFELPFVRRSRRVALNRRQARNG